ncbi:MAG: flagellar basal-body rod protein FlgF [Myxococcales bacterium]|nr:flagellar basal-body rod protein FlgF [Myxococcales bacterium]
MSDGIYTALSGAVATQNQLDLVSHNLANVSTPGYREQRIAFSDVLVQGVEDTRMVSVADSATNMTPAGLQSTGNPLDLALEGEGFFMVGNGRNPMLTRNGAFRLDAEGQLVTHSGLPVLDPNQNPIMLLDVQPSELRVAADGGIWTEFGMVGQIGAVEAQNIGAVRAAGDGFFQTNQRNLQPIAQGQVVQGFREGSNVNAVRGMTEMIMLHRHFDAMQQLIKEHRTLDERATRIGQAGS